MFVHIFFSIFSLECPAGSLVILCFQFGLSGWFTNYTFGCQMVDFSNSPQAVRVSNYFYWIFEIYAIVLCDLGWGISGISVQKCFCIFRLVCIQTGEGNMHWRFKYENIFSNQIKLARLAPLHFLFFCN